jgi:hypothetical protein
MDYRILVLNGVEKNNCTIMCIFSASLTTKGRIMPTAVHELTNASTSLEANTSAHNHVQYL